MDFYSEGNRNANVTFFSPVDFFLGAQTGSNAINSGGNTAAGQAFTGNGEKLRSARFSIKRVGSPTGNVVAKLYANTGTFGTTGKPTGSALATSTTIDITTLASDSYNLIPFNFDGTYRMVNGVNYVIVIEYSTGGDASNNLSVSFTFAGGHAGNPSFFNGSSWTALGSGDITFYVNGLETSYGQSFVGDGGSISKAKFYINKTGAPTGIITARIHAHTGTYGTNSTPSGAPLATSDNVDVSSLPTSQSLIEFPFSTPLETVNGTQYVVTLHFTPLNPTDTVNVGCDTSAPTAAGNSSVFDNGRWFGDSDKDLVFYVME